MRRLWILLLIIAAPAHAQADRPPAAKQKSVTVGTAHFPPFRIVGAKGEVGGVDAEIVKAAFRNLGYRVDMVAYPWSRTYKLGKSGRLPIIFSFTKSAEREKFFYFSDPINSVKDVFFVNRKRGIKWKKLADLKGMTVGVSQGYAYDPEFMKLIDDGVIKADYAAGANPELIHLRKLEKNRLDLFICEASVCSYQIQGGRGQFADVDYINRVVGKTRTFHLGFSKTNPDAKRLLGEFNSELARMRKQGELDRLYRRFGIVANP